MASTRTAEAAARSRRANGASTREADHPGSKAAKATKARNGKAAQRSAAEDAAATRKAVTKAWKDVDKTFAAITSRLGEDVDALTAQGRAERKAIVKAVRAALTSLEDIVDLAGQAVTDPRLRKDLAKLARKVRDAVGVSIDGLGDQLRLQAGEARTDHRAADEHAGHLAHRRSA